MTASAPIPIGFVLTSFHAGGTERQFSELVARLDPARYAVHVACFRRDGQWRGRVEAAALSVTEFPLRSFRSAGTVAALARYVRWCRAHRLEVVQAADFYANVFGLTGAWLAGVPVRVGSRRDLRLPGRSAAQHRLQRQAYRAAHRIVANSRAAAAQLGVEGVPGDRVTVIHNGLDSPAAVRRRTPGNPCVITMVANLRPGKGHECLLDAIAALHLPGRSLRVQLAGDGPLRDALAASIVARQLSDRVRLLGHQDDVPALLADTDIFVLPSTSEAFPNGLMEAMSCGVPVVASDVGGIPELVRHGENGLLVPPGDAAALAAALNRLIADPDGAARLGLAARESVVSRYTFDVMTRAFDELYTSERQRAGLVPASRGGRHGGTSLAQPDAVHHRDEVA